MDDFEAVRKFRRRVVIVQAPAIDGFRKVTRFGVRQATRNTNHLHCREGSYLSSRIHMRFKIYVHIHNRLSGQPSPYPAT